MTLTDAGLLVRKILVGILVILIPFLIIWGSLQLIPKTLQGRTPQPKSTIQPN